ncbi:hypothetical protein Y710_16475 [Gordonia sp. QH-12]|uniref:hypothetical protein n=1 Tax=Gordonia TaxID=2053 RepID=UPI000783BF53|nr:MULTISPECIES: hypothetical protein [Gordonia]KXT55939.1 hypothetical protein Y710_16475 [Gordonia sp. QH-12]WFN94155.1 hypothetical protein P5P27_06310 [Gordonia sihwensis]WFN94216.1 hypothetical protein P5P27_06620 [Gordonia sihwensis]
MTRGEHADYARAYRIITGRTTQITVPPALIGHLWQAGGDTVRALLSVAVDPQALEACRRIVTDGIAVGQGSGRPLTPNREADR